MEATAATATAATATAATATAATATAATAPTLTVNGGTGSGQHDAGTMVTVTANPAPSGQQFAGWSGDIQILANPFMPTTTATMPSIDVTITPTYADKK
jgi:hypothetical protein